MKKLKQLFYIIFLTSFGFGLLNIEFYTQAQALNQQKTRRARQNMVDTIVDLVKTLENKTIEQPVEMGKAWANFKSEKLDLAAKEFRLIAKGIRNPESKRSFNQLAQHIADLSQEFSNLKFPDKPMKKSMKYIRSWIDIVAEQLLLASRQFLIIAKQTHNRQALNTSQYKLNTARKVIAALRSLYEQSNQDNQNQNNSSAKSQVSAQVSPEMGIIIS